MELGNDEKESDSLSNGLFAMNQSPGGPAESVTTTNAQSSSLASMDDEEYESADDILSPEDAVASNLPTQTRLIRTEAAGSVLNDAFEYLDRVKVQFIHQLDTYNQFLDIMKSFKSEVLDSPGVIDWVSTLFLCHPELIQRFNNFLPKDYRIECGTVDNYYAF